MCRGRWMRMLSIVGAIAIAPLNIVCADVWPSTTRTFAIRADPAFAPQVNQLFKDIARPDEIPVPKNTRVDVFLRERCGSSARRSTRVEQLIGTETDLLRFIPCLRVRRVAAITATSSRETLAAVARRMGLGPDGPKRLTHFRGSFPTFRHLASGTPILKGDTLVAREAAQWTTFEADSSKASSVDDLSSACSLPGSVVHNGVQRRRKLKSGVWCGKMS